jgi:hypothetical protein
LKIRKNLIGEDEISKVSIQNQNKKGKASRNISKDGAPQKEYTRNIHKWKLLGAVLHQKH